MPNTVNLFCAICNETATFSISIDGGGEFLCACTTCGHAVKFPGDADLSALIAEHNEHNVPRVLVDPETGNPVPSPEQQAAIDQAVEDHG